MHSSFILDAFWSRARQTVTSNVNRFRERVSMLLEMRFEPPYNPPGPLPPFDYCGYKIAISMVAKSLQPVRHSETYTQWDTIRKFKSTHSNQSRGGRIANTETMILTDSKGGGYEFVGRCGSNGFAWVVENEWVRIGVQIGPSVIRL